MDRRPAAPWAPSAVVLLTVAWLLGALVLLNWLIDIGSGLFWVDPDMTQRARADWVRRRDTALLLLAVEVVAGPMVIAVVAVCGQLRRTAAVYLLIAFGLCLLAVPVAPEAYRDINPPSPPPPAPTRCQERSGGEASCPGG
ncbi:hypothetical protein [Salinispora sp. H7-4]|uniref:hypothetical protein n=1 Tax=Salinispora sp. H7-4 TaxID=2748321 RepID=UPI0015D0D435|nr:hypothetical protein [Salinispora sp. H7-4]NYT96232.1 hypothetical protein [Salinispora sp. H7-4]